MTATATAPHPSPTDPQADLRAEDALYYRRVLHGLIDRGADMARLVHETATAQADAEGEADGPAAPMTLPEAVVAFDRLSRAVRRTVVLARKLSEPVPPRPAVPRPDQHRAAARRQIIRAVEDAIQREAEGADIDALEAELRERLDALSWTTRSSTVRWRRWSPISAATWAWAPCSATIPGSGACRRTSRTCARAAKPAESRPDADQHSAEPSPSAAPPTATPEVGGRFRTWSGPPAYCREASIELMQKLMEHKLPRIRGP